MIRRISALKDRINPCWGRSLLLHSSVIAAVVMIIYLVHGVGSLAQTLFVCAENELWLE